MTKTRKQLEILFDDLYAEAEAILKLYKPCEVRVRSGHVKCLGCRKQNTSNSAQDELCCGGCRFHSVNGCTAEKPLACKLWLCHEAKTKYPKAAKRLLALREIAFSNHLYVVRGDKAKSLRNAVSWFRWSGFRPTLLTIKKLFV